MTSSKNAHYMVRDTRVECPDCISEDEAAAYVDLVSKRIGHDPISVRVTIDPHDGDYLCIYWVPVKPPVIKVKANLRVGAL